MTLQKVPGSASPGRNGDALSLREKLLLYLPLFFCALLLLLGNLAMLPLTGSEGRWAGIVREMFLTKDFLHPTINFEPYFDKPLFSYWCIAFVSLMNKGIVTEFFARIPSAVSALFALWAVISAARTLFSEKTAVVSAWVFMTFYAFAFWGRLAEADMMNLAFSTCAFAWYLKYRDSDSLTGYLVFALLCFVGAQAKGLGALAVPVMLAVLDMILRKTWKKHLNWKSFLAVAIGIVVYILPLYLAKLIPPVIPPEAGDLVDLDGTAKTSGFALVFRENIIRFFKPFDHKSEGVFAYFIHVPRLTLPWSPFVISAFLVSAYRLFRKEAGESERYLLFCVTAVFLLFTLSGSRRVYYILPILPYCAILTGLWLSEENMPLRKLRDILLGICAVLPVIAAFAGAAVTAFFAFFPKYLPYKLTDLSPLTAKTSLALAGAGIVIYFLSGLLKNLPERFSVILPSQLTVRAVLSITAAMVLVFVFFFPMTASFRTEKMTSLRIAWILLRKGIAPANVYFYDRVPVSAAFYLNFPQRIRVIEAGPAGKEKLRTLFENPPAGGFYLIAEKRFFQSLPQEYCRNFECTLADVSLPRWVRNRKKGLSHKLVLLHSLPASGKGE